MLRDKTVVISCRILTMSVVRYGAYRRSGSSARVKWNCVVKKWAFLSLRIPLRADVMNHNQAVSATSFSLLNEKTLKCANGTCLLLSRGLKHSIISSPFFLLLGTPGAINQLVIYFCILFPFVTVENLHTHCAIWSSCGGAREDWILRHVIVR